MTTHYLDISLLPDPEFSAHHLRSALIAKLHRVLVQRESTDIGISFPQHKNTPASRRTLGDVLRLHGTDAALGDLMQSDWLHGMRDHVSQTPIAAVPANALHRQVERRQFKTSVDRLRRRRMQRKGETAEEAMAAIPDSVERTPDLPFVQLRSSSTGQPFSLFIAHTPPQQSAMAGSFNTYGLSQNATVPWF